MAFITETLELCHDLSDYGKENYRELLEKIGDEILYKHEHPISYWMEKIKDYIMGE